MGHVHYDLEFLAAGVNQKRRIGEYLFRFSRVCGCELKTPCSFRKDEPSIQLRLMKTHQHPGPGTEPIEKHLSFWQCGCEIVEANAATSVRVSGNKGIGKLCHLRRNVLLAAFLRK